MLANMGTTDRVVRLIVASALILAALTTQVGAAITIILFLLSGIAAVTALLGFCPLYRLFGSSANRNRR